MFLTFACAQVSGFEVIRLFRFAPREQARRLGFEV